MKWFALSILGLSTLIACSDADHDGHFTPMDCAPDNNAIHPDAEEVCDGKDNDCDGYIDEDVSITAYWDRDLDGFGDESQARRVCVLPDDGSLIGGDCDDLNPSIHPEAEEVCDQADNDCDALIDEDVGFSFYLDEDGDGHGTEEIIGTACVAPENGSATSDDCNDQNPLAWDNAPEVCDGIDNDCNGLTDEDLPLVRFWADNDGDGAGDGDQEVLSCGPMEGVVDNTDDCDDSSSILSPTSAEIPSNGEDDDCDGYIDEYAIPDQYNTWEEALAAAPDGSVIQFSEGTFFTTIDLTGRDVTLAGMGCEKTVIYADAAGTVIQMESGNLEHMTIAGGTADPIDGEHNGGGIRINGEMTGTGLCLVANSAGDNNEYTGGYGGGIAVLSGSAELTDCWFEGNASFNDGGAVFVAQDAFASIQRSHFIGNSSNYYDGGAIDTHGGELLISNCVFARNSAGDDGGAIAVEAEVEESAEGDSIYHKGTASITHCTFHDNKISLDGTARRGLAIYAVGGDAYIDSCAFTGHLDDKPVIESSVLGSSSGGNYTPSVVEINWSAFFENGAIEYRGHYVLDALRDDPQYVQSSAAISPNQWDFRLMEQSAYIDAGNPDLMDSDGSPSDIGAYGGPDADPSGIDAYLLDWDGDGILDTWEVLYGLNPWSADSHEDLDGDGLDNETEYALHTDPTSADSDGDGVSDGDEWTSNSDPTRPQDHTPFANSGSDQWVPTGLPINIDGSGSWDPNENNLTYAWELASPTGSTAQLPNPAAAIVSLTPDVSGVYTLTLQVSDTLSTHMDSVTIYAFYSTVLESDGILLEEAISQANSGDTIALMPGTYTGGLDLGGKDINLIGIGSPEDVVLESDGTQSVLLLDGQETITIANLTIRNGYAAEGGGIYAHNVVELGIHHVRFESNTADLMGGGLYAKTSAVTLSDVVFLENIANEGGGMYFSNQELNIYRTDFLSNGAFSDGGGLYIRANPQGTRTFTLHNVVFQQNDGERGGAVFQIGAQSTAELNQVTMVDNIATEGIYHGIDGTILLANSIFGHNIADYVFGGMNGQFYPIYNIFFGNSSGISEVNEEAILNGAGNQWDDPIFALYTDDDLPLNDLLVPIFSSPALDHGLPNWQDSDGSTSDLGIAGGQYANRDLFRITRDDNGDGISDGLSDL